MGKTTDDRERSWREDEVLFATRLRNLAADIEAGIMGVETFSDVQSSRAAGGGYVNPDLEPRWTLTVTYVGVRGNWMIDPDGAMTWSRHA